MVTSAADGFIGYLSHSGTLAVRNIRTLYAVSARNQTMVAYQRSGAWLSDPPDAVVRAVAGPDECHCSLAAQGVLMRPVDGTLQPDIAFEEQHGLHRPNPYPLVPEIIDEYPRPLRLPWRPCAWGACPLCGAAGNIVDSDYNWYLNPYNHGDSDPRSWWRRLVLDWPPWTDGEDAAILLTAWGGLLLCVAALGALLLTWIGLLP